MEDPDWIFYAVWNKEERMEGSNNAGYPRLCAVASKEI